MISDWNSRGPRSQSPGYLFPANVPVSSPHTHSPKCTCSNFIRVDNIRVHISVGGMDCVLLSRCPSQQCPYIRRSYGHFRNFNWLSRKSTLNLKLQRKFAFGKPLARFRQLHFSTIDKRKKRNYSILLLQPNGSSGSFGGELLDISVKVTRPCA